MLETNDYDSDILFGVWLKDQRTKLGVSIEDVSKKSGIPIQRLKSLEVGYAERGITRTESEKLSGLYKISLEDFLRRASGGN